MTLNNVLIRGDGVAARCCSHLLSQAGYQISFERKDRPRVPLIMLSQAAQSLIADVFQKDNLFADLPVIRKRIVAWGAAPAELDHAAVIVSEEVLLERLGGLVSSDGNTDWTICAATPLPAETVEHRFGSRMASAVKVEHSPRDACWIEAVEDGWLFLNSGWLIGVGRPPDELLARSNLIRGQVSECGKASAQFASAPRMITPLGGKEWIACGSAAMGFDPLCGDGTAHAVREAILASAVIRAADSGEAVSDLMEHYQGRLIAGFQRHLAECFKFYSSGGSGAWWQAEAAACVQGIQWCRGHAMEFRYRLEGLELVKRDA